MNKEKFIEHCGTLPEGTAVLCFEELGSTSDYVKARALAGENLIVTAQHQTGGRGRIGPSFLSEPRGIYLSLSYRPPRPLDQCLHYTSLAAVAVRDALFQATGLEWCI